MRNLRVQATDTAAAMDEIYAKLGPDALILSTTKQNGKVVMEATIDNKMSPANPNDFQNIFTDKMIGKSQSPGDYKNSKYKDQNEGLSELRADVAKLFGLFETLIITDDNGISPRFGKNPKIRLRNIGFSAGIIRELGESFANVDYEAGYQNFFSDIAQRLAHVNPETILDKKVIFVVGPTGSGRTTMAGKIIGMIKDQKSYKRIMLGKMQEVTSNERELENYGRLLNAPICSFGPDTPSNALNKINDVDTLVVDVAETNLNTCKKIELFTDEIGQKDVSVILTVPGSTNVAMIARLTETYEKMAPIVALTKLDECETTPSEFSIYAQNGFKIGLLSGSKSLVEPAIFASEDILLQYLTENFSASLN